MNIEMAEHVLKLLADARNSAAAYSFKNIMYGKKFVHNDSTEQIWSMNATRSDVIRYPYNASYSVVTLENFIDDQSTIDLSESEWEYLKMLNLLDKQVNQLDHKLFKIYRSTKAYYKNSELEIFSMNFSTRRVSSYGSDFNLVLPLSEIVFEGLPDDI